MKRSIIIRIFVYTFIVFGIIICVNLNKKLQMLVSEPDPQLKFLNFQTYSVGEKPIYNGLKENGISDKDILLITKKLDNCFRIRSLRPEDKYTIYLKEDGSFHRIQIIRGLNLHYVAMCSSDLTNNTLVMDLVAAQKSVNGTIESSLWNSMTDLGITPNMIMNFADLFAWTVDFLNDVRQGDAFGIIWNEMKTATGQIVGRDIIAAYYYGSETGKKIVVKFENEYYNEKGEVSKRMFLKAPLQYRRISSMFTARRLHPVLKIYRAHNGIDYAAPTGTPVSAVANGTVRVKGWNGGLGNYVEIKHQFGYTTGYGHLSRFANIKVGQKVKQGDVVGYVGSTGLSSGPHLDFRIKLNGKFLNFLKVNNRSAGTMPKKDIARFKEETKDILEQLKEIGA